MATSELIIVKLAWYMSRANPVQQTAAAPRNLTGIPSVWYTLPVMAKTVKHRKDPAAVALGRKGGRARIAKLSKEERSRLARLAVQTRWARAKAAKDTPPEGR